jgi:TonB family protein
MVVVSAVAHAALIVGAIWVLAGRADERPLPLVAYTVEITDPNALGGRLPPGAPGKPLTGGPTAPPGLQGRPEPPPPEPVEAKPAPTPPEPPPVEAKAPEPKPVETKPAEPPRPPPEPKPAEAKPPEPKPEEPAVSLEQKPTPPKPEPKKVEPPKPEPKPQVAKPEPPKPALEPKKPEPAKPEATKVETAKAAPGKPEPGKPEPKAATTAKDANAPAGKEAGRDDYAAAAERWRSRSDKQGGGLGGDGGSGPIGAGGEGPGGGGQLVGIEFLAYRQQVINTVKAQWTNVIARPGLVTVIRFEIGPGGEVGAIKIERSSGNPAYDASATRAVQRANPLPAPPSRYAREFSEFLIEFHSEEQGGQGAG